MLWNCVGDQGVQINEKWRVIHIKPPRNLEMLPKIQTTDLMCSSLPLIFSSVPWPAPGKKKQKKKYIKNRTLIQKINKNNYDVCAGWDHTLLYKNLPFQFEFLRLLTGWQPGGKKNEAKWHLMISGGRFAVLTQINVITLTSLALVSLRQVLWCVGVDALGVNELAHTLGVHRPSHHPTVVHNHTHDVSVNRGIEESCVVRGSEATPLDGGYRARATAE